MTRLSWLTSCCTAALLLFGAGATAKAERLDQRIREGAEVYNQGHCYACHGQFGSGTLGPRFSGDLNLKETSYVVTQILVGLGEMPAYAHRLSDDQIAAVAQYIRNSWGNAFGGVTPEDVAKAREMRRQAARQTTAPSAAQH
ncbi:MAG: cytochrome c [Terriglobales bacterium]